MRGIVAWGLVDSEVEVFVGGFWGCADDRGLGFGLAEAATRPSGALASGGWGRGERRGGLRRARVCRRLGCCRERMHAGFGRRRRGVRVFLGGGQGELAGSRVDRDGVWERGHDV